MKGEDKTKEQLLNELIEMRRRIAELEKSETQRKQTEERIKHLNDVLRAIRNVNQLITKEKERDGLLQGACHSLIETRGYYNAWTAVWDESGRPVRSTEAGLGKGFLPMMEQLKRGELTDCGRKALVQPGVFAIEDPTSTCTDCPLSGMYHGRGAMTCRLEHAGRVFGLLSVSIPKALVADEEEQSLFRAVAGDIALALHNIELEEERKKAQEELERSAIYLDAMGDALFVLDAQGNIIKNNKAALKWWGYSAEEFLKMTEEQLFVEREREKCHAEMEEVVRTGALRYYETIALTKDGKEILVRNSGTVMKDAEGELMGFINVFRDITERKRTEEELKKYREHLETLVEERTAELKRNNEQLQQEITERKKAEEALKASLKEKEILLREIHHRVKNNMQIIYSLTRLQSRYIQDETSIEVLKEIQNRVRSMHLIHEKLYQSKDLANIDFNEYVPDLINALYRAYGVDRGKIESEVNVKDVSLGIDLAVPCGLIINELVSNSLKYAFPEGREGKIKVTLCPIDKNQIELVVSDNGVGIPKDLDFRKTESLGLHLVTILAEDQLEGKIELDRTKGTKFKIKFKVPK